VPWLQPFPDALAARGADDPAIVVTTRASMRLALIAALQYLPPRQRAVLILRDVLGWHAVEAAELLDMSTAAANSALQRARAQIASLAPTEDNIAEPADPKVKDLLGRYAAAFETADVSGLTELLREDAVLEMPPMLVWFAGRDRVSRFLGRRVLVRAGEFTLKPVHANGQPAFAAYMCGAGGEFEAHAIQVLTVAGGGISRIVSFNDGGLFPPFNLPATLPGR
jgi:RNA polymerase sigma-70 factor (ECF subfamily)